MSSLEACPQPISPLGLEPLRCVFQNMDSCVVVFSCAAKSGLPMDTLDACASDVEDDGVDDCFSRSTWRFFFCSSTRWQPRWAPCYIPTFYFVISACQCAAVVGSWTEPRRHQDSGRIRYTCRHRTAAPSAQSVVHPTLTYPTQPQLGEKGLFPTLPGSPVDI